MRRRNWRVGAFAGLALAVVAATIWFSASQGRETVQTTLDNQALLDRIQRESNARRNETCALFERQEAANIARVRGSYRYLLSLPRREWGTSLTVAVVQGLPATEREAIAARAPTYCNAEGVGLPEPPLDACRRDLPSCLALPARHDFSRLLKAG
jgi:hypothetical protein